MAEHDGPAELSPDVEVALKKASEEIIATQDGAFFSVGHSAEPTEDVWKTSAVDKNALAEFSNFDVLGDEEVDFEYSQLIKSQNHVDILGDGNVIKSIMEEGVGQVVPENYTVLIHYIAYVSNLHEPFDVTYMQGKRPQRYTLGEGELLPGLEIGIKTMRMGETARIIVKPPLAYREMGCPPRIPPNATILFDVHLVYYVSPEKRLIFDKDNLDPQRFSKNIIKVKKLHVEGNEQFKQNNLERAIDLYNRAVNLLHITGGTSEVEEVDTMKYLNKLYTNLSLCYLKRCAFTKVCRMAVEATKYSERFSKFNAKLYFNWGKALRLLKDFSESKFKLQKALKIEPHNIIIRDELRKLDYDREFNSNIEHFTFDDNKNSDDECLPIAFWEVFDNKLLEFLSCDDDVLTVKLKYPSDIQLAKNKASSYNLKCHIVTKAGVETDCLAIKK